MTYDRITKEEVAIATFLGSNMGLSAGYDMGKCEFDSWDNTTMVNSSNELISCNSSKLCHNNNYQEERGTGWEVIQNV